MGRSRGKRSGRSRGPKRIELLEQNRHGDLANAIGTIAASLALLLGLLMIILGATRGDKCKMRAIDQSSWTADDKDGNLIKWFKYTGSLLLITGLLANTTIGACPAAMRTCCPGIGGAISDIMVGVCGKMILFLLYLVTLLCNILGQFWLSMASEARTSFEGINYCAGDIWFMAHFVVNSFWVLSILGGLSVFSAIFRFCRSEESRRQPVGKYFMEFSNLKPYFNKTKVSMRREFPKFLRV